MSDSIEQSGNLGNQEGVRLRLDRLEAELADLKVLYEQYFSGILPRAPEKAHNEVKRAIRDMRKAPFKSLALQYRLKMIESRYNTYNTYWMRVGREREEGIYAKDVFKANIREKNAAQEKRDKTTHGAAERHMKSLFDVYRNELEKQTGKRESLDYEAFQKNIVQRAKEFKEKHGTDKLSFKVVVKDGKVVVSAKANDLKKNR